MVIAGLCVCELRIAAVLPGGVTELVGVEGEVWWAVEGCCVYTENDDL